MRTEFTAEGIDDLSGIAQKIIELMEDDRILLMRGDLGAGKTSLVKELIKSLGSTDEGSSPTYSLVNEYLNEDGSNIYHLDLYRIEDKQELIEIGLEDILYSGSYCFIEWPDIAVDIIPEEAINLEIKTLDEHRRKILIFRE